MSNSIRELSQNEMNEVSGGILPVLAAIGSFAGHASVKTVGGYLLSRAMTAYAIYGAAQYLSQR